MLNSRVVMFSTQNDTSSAFHHQRHRYGLGALRFVDDFDWTEKFTSIFKVFRINFSKWMNAIYYSMERDLNAESASASAAADKRDGLSSTFVLSSTVRRKHIVSVVVDRIKIYCCCEWAYWLEWNALNENTNLKHSSRDVHTIEKNAFMQWLLSGGTIIFHYFLSTIDQHRHQHTHTNT